MSGGHVSRRMPGQTSILKEEDEQGSRSERTLGMEGGWGAWRRDKSYSGILRLRSWGDLRRKSRQGRREIPRDRRRDLERIEEISERSRAEIDQISTKKGSFLPGKSVNILEGSIFSGGEKPPFWGL